MSAVPSSLPVHPPLPCPECPGRMFVKNSRFGLFWGCENWPLCKATHGAHPDGKPLGVPADKATKLARIAAHDAFDRLWKTLAASYQLREIKTSSQRRNERHILKRQRTRAYRWLADALGVRFDDCHIGAFDSATCERVVSVCASMDADSVRTWAKDRGH